MKKPDYQNLPLAFLEKGLYQPRKVFDQEALEELAASIKVNGLIQPLVVRPKDQGRYEIIAGERRWRAAQLAGLSEVACLINNYSDAQAAAITTIENINRTDLNPIEEASAYQRLTDEFGYIHEEIAAIVGKSRVKITNTLRLLKLTTVVQELLITGELSEGHGKALVSLPETHQTELAMQATQKGWSVRKLEQEIKNRLAQTDVVPYEDANIRALEQKISEQVGAPVKLETDAPTKGGWLKIRYFNDDTLSGLLDKMGVSYADE